MDASQNAGNKPKGSSKWVAPRVTRSTPVYTEDEDLAPAPAAQPSGPVHPPSPSQQVSDNYTGSSNQVPAIDYTAAIAEALGPFYPPSLSQQVSNDYTSSLNPMLATDYTAAVAEAFGPSYPQNPFQQAGNNYTDSSNQVPAPGFAAAPGPSYSPNPFEQADESIRDLDADDARTTYFIRGLQRQIADISGRLRQHLARCPRGNVDELVRERKAALERMRRARMKLDRPTPESALPRAKRAKLVSSNMDDSTLVTTLENRIKLERTIREIHESVGDLKHTLDKSVNEP
ncbi:hypothetical protein FPOA_09151 [Fusarium poae]|uniref:Uncharacterized protein n=1 Tax=Fusarium poae TaxID=36050 RepID=A0A1B8AQQ7_FUSPO|nr:hypothetical protein FPOA_09151 [Fusarium poae]